MTWMNRSRFDSIPEPQCGGLVTSEQANGIGRKEVHCQVHFEKQTCAQKNHAKYLRLVVLLCILHLAVAVGHSRDSGQTDPRLLCAA